jgi:tRNA (guanine37-N1)-methyltransferase
MSWDATILTVQPDMFPGPLGMSLCGKALAENVWTLETHDIRSHSTNRYGSVDDTPAGGGPGMVMRADIVAAAIDAIERKDRPRILLSPRGKPFTQARAHQLAEGPGAIFVCGRFEGIDQRVIDARDLEEISIGDYVLSGGELAAMILIDAVVRLLPGVLGANASLDEESFEQGLLEYPHYTRPQVWEGREIPETLTSGHHKKIRDWRHAQSLELTKSRRPDLWDAWQRRNGSASTKH